MENAMIKLRIRLHSNGYMFMGINLYIEFTSLWVDTFVGRLFTNAKKSPCDNHCSM